MVSDLTVVLDVLVVEGLVDDDVLEVEVVG